MRRIILGLVTVTLATVLFPEGATATHVGCDVQLVAPVPGVVVGDGDLNECLVGDSSTTITGAVLAVEVVPVPDVTWARVALYELRTGTPRLIGDVACHPEGPGDLLGLGVFPPECFEVHVDYLPPLPRGPFLCRIEGVGIGSGACRLG